MMLDLQGQTDLMDLMGFCTSICFS